MRKLQPCPSYAAYLRHSKAGERCQPCLDALREYQQHKQATDTRRCSEGCNRPPAARGWCRPCWTRWDRAGRPDSGPPTLEEAKAASAQRRALWPSVRRPRTESPKKAAYLEMRRDGVDRKVAAVIAGARLTSTYVWEPANA